MAPLRNMLPHCYLNQPKRARQLIVQHAEALAQDGHEVGRIDELEAIAREGVVVVLQIDGGRGSDPNILTVVLSGGTLAPEVFFRSDGNNLRLPCARRARKSSRLAVRPGRCGSVAERS